MYKVYLTDDHAILREGLKALLQDDPELVVTGESGSGRETIQEVTTGEFDLLVLDISLPDLDGLEVLARIKQKKPELSVLILTMHAEESLATRLLQAGADGYALKEMTPLQIIEAMRRVARGGRFLAPELAALVAERVSSPQPTNSLHERLTNREYAIFLKLAAGHSIIGIARELHLAPSTISTHRTHILEKLELSHNADLVRYAVSRNLLI